MNAVVLEAGVGGRFDSTNFIDRGCNGEDHLSCDEAGPLAVPLVTAIAHISLDHQAVLGYTLEEIAWQKCGAIKPGCDVFTCCTYQAPCVMRIIREECAKMGAKLHEVSLGEAAAPPTVDVPDAGLSTASGLVPMRHEYDVAAENRALSFAILQHVQQRYRRDSASDGQPAMSPETVFQSFYWPCR